ncbi:PucR family transcriptional regulator [Kibdelosporangium aridum]|uniref:PucR C-terminal helix-turn-helix domain-containing protein n=1 Tax=Kibdelosporangium aridum TaxID=2030 RepID=A0A1W2FU41_KIBAR|nr:helix-turn-helix domain-containing protein [Kibdelosporangium aridum]SMD25441.1 PucR C-terminal helix-turn-helix domain-containing protein [Kibdelosporangium aridum]
MTDRVDVPAVTRRAAQDAGGVSSEYLAGYIEMLDAVSVTGRRLARDELESRRALGASAAEQGIPLRSLVDLYLSANWLVWRELPAVASASDKREIARIAEAILRAADDAVVALADGYDEAQRSTLRQQEAERREFIDDLFYGRSDLGRLAERAERFGFRLAGTYVVTAAKADEPFTDGDAVTRRIESLLLRQFDTREVLVTTKQGLLVCIAPGSLAGVPAEFARHLDVVLGVRQTWQVAVGRPHPGPGGILRSYEETRGALELAASLGLDTRVLKATDLLVFQVLFRDRAAIIDLVGTVLGPLDQVRGGAQPLLATLAAYFAERDNATAAARRLYLSVRALTYRLDRIKQLTGQDPRDPAQRFTLEAAILGARLLNWPERPLQV